LILGRLLDGGVMAVGGLRRPLLLLPLLFPLTGLWRKLIEAGGSKQPTRKTTSYHYEWLLVVFSSGSTSSMSGWVWYYLPKYLLATVMTLALQLVAKARTPTPYNCC